MRIEGPHARLTRKETVRVLFTVAARYRYEAGASPSDLQRAVHDVVLSSDMTSGEIEHVMRGYMDFLYEQDQRPS